MSVSAYLEDWIDLVEGGIRSYLRVSSDLAGAWAEHRSRSADADFGTADPDVRRVEIPLLWGSF